MQRSHRAGNSIGWQAVVEQYLDDYEICSASGSAALGGDRLKYLGRRWLIGGEPKLQVVDNSIDDIDLALVGNRGGEDKEP